MTDKIVPFLGGLQCGKEIGIFFFFNSKLWDRVSWLHRRDGRLFFFFSLFWAKCMEVNSWTAWGQWSQETSVNHTMDEACSPLSSKGWVHFRDCVCLPPWRVQTGSKSSALLWEITGYVGSATVMDPTEIFLRLTVHLNYSWNETKRILLNFF